MRPRQWVFIIHVNKMDFLLKLLLLVIVLLPIANSAHAVVQESDCFWSNADDNTCTKTFPDGSFSPRSSSQCSLERKPLYTEVACCCPQKNIDTSKPKYIIIASVVSFFAILTIGILLYKKNE